MSNVSDLDSTRYDRLLMFYDNMKNEHRPFLPITRDCTLRPAVKVQPDKNMYKKYLRVPMSYGDRKEYYVKIFDDYYKLYRNLNNFYFIDVDGNYPKWMAERAFFTSILPSYIVVATFELIKWLTGARNRYRLKMEDEVFAPIFNQPQWDYDDYDCKLLITLYPANQNQINDKTIPISIFK